MNVVLLAVSTFFYVNAPVVELREKPLQESEVVSSAYYSERVNVVETLGDWLKVQTVVDSYEGWIPKNIVFLSQNELFKDQKQQVAKIARLSCLVYDRKDIAFGPALRLPFECSVLVQDASDKRWITVRTLDGKDRYIQRGDLSFDSKALSMQELIALADQFLGLPYTWGGRSSLGYDCSGFVQMLFRQMNIALPRDSKDQLNFTGFATTTKEELKPGDLIFWGLAEDRIRHVGLYIGNDEFIHASARENMPWIRKSRLSDLEWNGQGLADAGYKYRTFRTLCTNLSSK